jgi:hypothetical protein
MPFGVTAHMVPGVAPPDFGVVSRGGVADGSIEAVSALDAGVRSTRQPAAIVSRTVNIERVCTEWSREATVGSGLAIPMPSQSRSLLRRMERRNV